MCWWLRYVLSVMIRLKTEDQDLQRFSMEAAVNLADRIQQLRKRKGISQEELVDRIGVPKGAKPPFGA